MVSQQKTRLAKLRAMLGSMGSESRFPKLVGLSASWIKKASAGNLPMTARAASAIHDATGVDLSWIMGDSKSVDPLEHGGKPYTIESYLNWKQSKAPDWGNHARLYNPVSLRYILKVLAFNDGKKTQTAAACELFEFAQSFRTKYGGAQSPGKYGKKMLEHLLEMSVSFGDHLFSEPLKQDLEHIGRQDGKPTPQKKQPLRKSKRPGGH